MLRNQAGRRFAIIIDETHCSQSGKRADSMSQALADSAEEVEAEFDATEKALLDLQKLRGPQENLSYLAFTATPKNVTMERFGRKGADGKPHAFHAYTMRQTIEEGFILDGLRNYQTYKSYAKLEKAIEDDPRLSERRSARKVVRFIEFHGTAMSQKAEVIVEHFRRHALLELGGQAKAMVVTSSREHAIRTQQAIEAHIGTMDYADVRALVAFSGEIVVDGHPYTEAGMNGFGEKELPKHFDAPATTSSSPRASHRADQRGHRDGADARCQRSSCATFRGCLIYAGELRGRRQRIFHSELVIGQSRPQGPCNGMLSATDPLLTLEPEHAGSIPVSSLRLAGDAALLRHPPGELPSAVLRVDLPS